MHAVVVRFSSMGDVALCLPVVLEALSQNPDLEITFISRKMFAPLFANISRCYFSGAETVGRPAGQISHELRVHQS